ncbi:hypothetical protein, partial [Mycoplasma marinum]
ATTVKVTLTKTSDNDTTGEVSWTGTTSATGTTKPGSVTGKLNGFETAAQKAARLLKDKADAALPQVTAVMVNKAINASKPHSSTDIASKWDLPASVNVTVGTGQDKQTVMMLQVSFHEQVLLQQLELQTMVRLQVQWMDLKLLHKKPQDY